MWPFSTFVEAEKNEAEGQEFSGPPNRSFGEGISPRIWQLEDPRPILNEGLGCLLHETVSHPTSALVADLEIKIQAVPSSEGIEKLFLHQIVRLMNWILAMKVYVHSCK